VEAPLRRREVIRGRPREWAGDQQALRFTTAVGERRQICGAGAGALRRFR
jgi:hypothetical protein